MASGRRGSRRWWVRNIQSSAQGVFQGATGFAVLAAGLWAGFAWGADGTIPLLVAGAVGAVFAVVLLATALRQAKGGEPTPVDRVAALRRALGDARRGGVAVGGQQRLGPLEHVVGQRPENRALPVVLAVDRIEPCPSAVPGPNDRRRPLAGWPDRRTPSSAAASSSTTAGPAGVAGRKWVRRHIRRAIGPISPTSSRNAANGANPMTWTSWRCGLRRAMRRALRRVAARRGGTAPDW